jgi:hypothetical protein
MQPSLVSSSGMAWVIPQYSRAQVNLAGRTRIASASTPAAREAVLSVINNWRSSHSFPLNSIQMTLRRRALKVYSSALIAQRLKRLSSIEAKLLRFQEMKLSQMQDIGGCRAVLRNVKDVDHLVGLYKQSKSKNPRGRNELLREDDYIAAPKEDGYRGVHLIYRYYSESKQHHWYNDLKIEIQLRSRLQHIWATAVETVGTFTNQALKSDQGDKDWLRFFALMGSALALKERRPLVPNTPTEARDLVQELRDLTHSLRVEKTLDAWRNALRFWLPPPTGPKDPYYYLLFLDAEARNIEVTQFRLGQLLAAQEAYATAEKRVEENPGAQAVLVSVEDLSALRRAYPNYFLDTRAFLAELRSAIRR